MGDIDALQRGTDLLEDFLPVRDDDHPGSALQDLIGDVAEEDCLSGSSGADRQRPLGAGPECRTDVLSKLVLVGAQFHREPKAAFLGLTCQAQATHSPA